MPADCLIRDARIVDGTGAPWFVSDVLLRNGRIAEIGKSVKAQGASVVDARGLYLAPGFIDAHCHDDLICLREPDRITVLFDTGVFETFATESSGTSTLVSGKYAAAHPRAVA